VNDPRYAKKPPPENGAHATHTMLVSGVPTAQVGLGVGLNSSGTNPSSIVMPPPPPYSVAVASEPLHLVISGQNNNGTMVDANSATVTVPITTTEEIQTSGVAPVAPKETEEIQTSPIFVPVLPQHVALEVQQQQEVIPDVVPPPQIHHHHHQ